MPDDELVTRVLTLAAVRDRTLSTPQLEADRSALLTDLQRLKDRRVGPVLEGLTAEWASLEGPLMAMLDVCDYVAPTVGLTVSAFNALVEPEHLYDSRLLNRVSGLLDLLMVEFTPVEALTTFQQTAEHIAEGSQHPGVRRAVFGGQMLLAFVAGAHGFTGGYVTSALASSGDFLARQLQQSSEDLAREVVQLLTLAQALSTDGAYEQVPEQVMVGVCDLLLEASRRTAGNRSEEQRRVLRSALDMFEPGLEHLDLIMPKAVGVRCDDAEAALELLGLRVSSKDHSSEDRYIVNKGNWRVQTQSVSEGVQLPQGAAVMLTAHK